MLGALRKESQRVTSRVSMISATGTPLMPAGLLKHSVSNNPTNQNFLY